MLLESALAVVFNWRPFVETFNARAVKPMVSLGAAWVFVSSFGIDTITRLANTFTDSHDEPSTVGYALTAMVLAGGSAGVNNILVALGYRQQRTPDAVAPKPARDQAWIAVKLTRLAAVGDVSVFIGPLPATPSAAAGAQPAGAGDPWDDVSLAGVISGTSLRGVNYFIADTGRFPTYGGHAVPANAKVAVKLQGKNKAGADVSQRWGPFTVAGGSIIDLKLQL